MEETDRDCEIEVHQLVYASAATRALDNHELEQILASARSNNKGCAVSGMLLYHEGSFLQALEGDREIVEALFEKIERDERHTDAVVLYRGSVEERSFGQWSMGFFRPVDSGAGPPGLNGFLRKGFVDGGLDGGGDKARELLLAFREGRWRRLVQ